MSERVLKALMQLFAIIAKINDGDENDALDGNNSHQIIRSFLKVELASNKINQYVELFDASYAYLGTRKKSKNEETGKRTSVHSVKVLRICDEINKELTIRQKFIVLMRIMELILQDGKCSETEFAFVKTVADTFKIADEEYTLIFNLLKNEIDVLNPPENCFIITGEKTDENSSEQSQKITLAGLDKPIVCIRIRNNDFIFFKYLGNDDIYLNGELLDNRKAFLFNQGASVNTSKSERIYQVDLINRLQSNSNEFQQFVFEAKDVVFRFPSTNLGIQSFSCAVESGQLVGIMGASGAGKSTLVNLLTGAKAPQSGSVTINGIDIHQSPKETEGIIGYVSQEDLLMEDLTVYQNLYYSAKLSFGSLSEVEIQRKVLRLLDELGLSAAKNLKIGSPMKKVISGGQRKRLNIALELIRNPSILFVDEPTSGLSSVGSLQIMNLLKDLSLKGTLVFVVIHQPSSDVFKLFNRLIILDNGGYQIFDGAPTNALTHFKRLLQYANADSEGCNVCGNVNPEQIFETIESQIVNEFGIPTKDRKIAPKKWNEFFLEYKKNEQASDHQKLYGNGLPPPINRPNRLKQLAVFFNRDFVSKITNRQYVWFILAEAPILAFIMSFFLKYYVETKNTREYIYYYNENIPTYLFVSILVSIFLGMTVAAEEIHKDKRNLKREKFLHLSWGSYLVSKVGLLIIVSAIQSFLFVLVGNLVLGINELWIENWLILFSVSVWSNLLGLNISYAFNQTKLIYIIIPILIIPQMIFSGLIIRYDRMNPVLNHPHEVPWVGNLMISRWAYEGLTVAFATDNSFSSQTYSLQKKSSEAQWKKDYWIPEIQELAETGKHIDLIKSEIQREEQKWNDFKCTDCFNETSINKGEISRFLSVLQRQYTSDYNSSIDSLDAFKQHFGLEKYNEFRKKYNNENLERLVAGKDRVQKLYIDFDNNAIYQLKDPIYQSSNGVRFFDAPYYIKEKSFAGLKLNTFFANVVVIWLFSLLLYIFLYTGLLKKGIVFYRQLSYRLRKRG